MEKDIKVEFLGNYYGRTQNFDGSVFSVGGAAPTLVASMAHGCSPKIIEICKRNEVKKLDEINMIGQMDNTQDHTFESANRIYGTDGISPTIPTGVGGGHTPKIMECCAMRGRGENNEQQLEVRSDGCTNSITTVQKDNIILVRQATKEGVIPCQVGGGSRSQLSQQQHKTRKSARQWKTMSDSDNGEYP